MLRGRFARRRLRGFSSVAYHFQKTAIARPRGYPAVLRRRMGVNGWRRYLRTTLESFWNRILALELLVLCCALPLGFSRGPTLAMSGRCWAVGLGGSRRHCARVSLSNPELKNAAMLMAL